MRRLFVLCLLSCLCQSVFAASATDEFLLPAVDLPELPAFDAVAAGKTITIEQFEFVGGEVLERQLLDNIAAPYRNRPLGYSDLLNLRDELTLAYVNRGYVTSGAVIESQSINDGVLRIQLNEGRLGAINVASERFRTSHIQNLLAVQPGDVVDVGLLEKRIRRLQRDPRIESVSVALMPGESASQTNVLMSLVESPNVMIHVGVNNQTSPSVGAEAADFSLSHNNVLGSGDMASLAATHTQGLDVVELGYSFPVTPANGQVMLYARQSSSEIIDDVFDGLDIQVDSENYSIGFRQPFFLGDDDEVAYAITADFKRASSSLLGQGFSFSPGADDGETRVSALRLGSEWHRRQIDQVFSVRSVASVGLRTLGATQQSGDTPDSQFVSWLMQAQWARRLGRSELRGRLDWQLTDAALLGLEQIAVGGASSVRGYRENLLVRDSGVIASMEIRHPLWQSDLFRLDGALFLDAGYARNVQRAADAETLLAPGLGLHLSSRLLNLSLELGEALNDVSPTGEYNLQDDGLHFSVNFRWQL